MASHMIGTPINFAVRPITDEACVPQLFNSSGFPFWGDPANFPWTVGNILNYVTETEIWCQAIVDEFGEGARVAALIMNNDFGKTYQGTLQACAEAGQIDLVEEQLHDPAAPDVTNEMTTIIGTDADVFIAGTTAAFCPQAVGSVAGADWRPRFYMSYTCGNLASFFEPVKDAAGLLSDEGAGVRMTNSLKIFYSWGVLVNADVIDSPKHPKNQRDAGKRVAIEDGDVDETGEHIWRCRESMRRITNLILRRDNLVITSAEGGVWVFALRDGESEGALTDD